MSNQSVTLSQVQKILKLAANGQVQSSSVKVHSNGNVEFELRHDDAIVGKLLAFVIIDPDGEQLANVTPGTGNSFFVRRFTVGYSDFETSTVSGPKDDTTVQSVAYNRAREYATEVAADRASDPGDLSGESLDDQYTLTERGVE